jgi:hypothetical protein
MCPLPWLDRMVLLPRLRALQIEASHLVSFECDQMWMYKRLSASCVTSDGQVVDASTLCRDQGFLMLPADGF